MNDEWLYYKVYPGGFGHLDRALAVVADLIDRHRRDIGRWFFIRYVDEVGPHLRVRVRPRPGRVGPTHDATWGALAGWLAEPDPPPRRHMWLVVEENERHPYSSTTKALELAVYEPEWRKYGGRSGVELAEEMFQRSSELVLRVTHRGGDDGVTRAAVARALMVAPVAADVGPTAREFWSQYGAYWMRGVRGDRLSADVRRARGEAGTVARSLEAAWAAALDDSDLDLERERDEYVDAVARYLSRAVPITGRSRHSLLFHQVHMTNNRLGLSPVEESILALPLAEEVA